ncbi:hypothetical protein M3603_15370 [Rummeliibacillus stabekisii]|uniref:hypothetical protein n=1 Tax=Rummeliibacillus stabekisii TaxID=241244 RepID=UPI00203F5780|nr:hypothetical protein [Rummeliibacillus stabekisii]MCM3317997.1 hypothetical protein [Rummeliibacillus stabekisii]
MELYLLNKQTEVLEKLQEAFNEQPGIDCEEGILNIADKYRESLIEGNKLFAADGERAKYRVTWASWSTDENKLYFDVAESDERVEFHDAYKRVFKLPTPASIGFGSYLYGYVDGERYLISKTVEQICAFIMKYRMQDVQIIDILDQLELETSMGFIMHCANQQFLHDQLLPMLIPMQQGEVEAEKFVPHSL